MNFIDAVKSAREDGKEYYRSGGYVGLGWEFNGLVFFNPKTRDRKSVQKIIDADLDSNWEPIKKTLWDKIHYDSISLDVGLTTQGSFLKFDVKAALKEFIKQCEDNFQCVKPNYQAKFVQLENVKGYAKEIFGDDLI